MEPGLYLTFFTAGESFESELPPVGPLEHLVIRERSLVADRRSVDQGNAFGGGGRWIEAELELQRAMGNEPGGARRPNLRVNAANGVYLKFASFGDPGEPVPELGPYAVVIVSPDSVEADGDLLATRTPHRLWELTSQGGSALTGVIRSDVAFRTKSTMYHPGIQSTRPKRDVFDATKLRPPRASRREAAAEELARPQAEEGSRATHAVDDSVGSVPSAPAKIDVQRGRLQPEAAAEVPLRARLGAGISAAQGSPSLISSSSRLDQGGIVSRLRLLTVGMLILAVAAVGAYGLRLEFSGTSVNVVGIGKTVNGPRWAYAVIKVSRASEAGAVRAHGTYLIVWVEMTNHGSDSARLRPTDFALVGPSGAQSSPLYETDPVYRSDSNSASPYTWTSSFPAGRPISSPLIFDVDPGLRGLELVVLEVPTVRIRLD